MNDYGPECFIHLASGGAIVCPAHPDECDYVRIVDDLGNEIAYWCVDEWVESPEQGMEVMGAILGAAKELDLNHGLQREQ